MASAGGELRRVRNAPAGQHKSTTTGCPKLGVAEAVEELAGRSSALAGLNQSDIRPRFIAAPPAAPLRRRLPSVALPRVPAHGATTGRATSNEASASVRGAITSGIAEAIGLASRSFSRSSSLTSSKVMQGTSHHASRSLVLARMPSA
mmetsp:Transcript_69442/g.192188  ORF Transcript_69442/g.192188 Transcript_69442/m.192188 type:complete len:148 (-) Transcript_69442:37-480(-)